MWNLLKYVPDVFVALRGRGIEYECPTRMFIVELKRSTGVMTDKTIGKWMKNLIELGYIKNKGEFVLELCTDFEHPYNFYSDNVPDVVRLKSEISPEEELQNLNGAKILKEK